MGKRKAFESFEWKAGGMILRIVEKRNKNLHYLWAYCLRINQNELITQ
jgi:hypothetical protein